MAKNLKASPASAFLNMPARTQPEPEPQATPPSPLTTQPTKTIKSTEAASSAPIPSTDTIETTFSMSLTKKSKKTKLTSLKVNEAEYEEFSKIVHEMGYKKSEIINQFIRDFVKANRK